MGKILGIAIQNYGSLKNIKWGSCFRIAKVFHLEIWLQSLKRAETEKVH